MDDVHCLDNSQSPIQDENINISDVIEVIETDPDFKPQQPPRQPTMFNQNAPVDPVQVRRQAQVRIVEQPASKALRFRYECEGRSAGSIPGASSTAENKTFPSIQITGYKGKAVVVVSCVTKDPPYRPHPHNLVGREGCRKGVCTLEISPESMAITFSNLGIQCVKKKDIEAHLKFREEIRVDPFKTGFDHRNQPTSIDLNAVRLCFQVFIEGDKPGKFTLPLAPVVSDPIYDKKAMSDLVIVKLSDCVSTVDGGRKDLILLCEKVAKEDIQVRFYEEKDGMIVWEGFGDFQPSQVHKQTAIWFKTPRYKTLDITEPVKVNIQLRRPSDGATSEPLPFELLPLDSGAKRKRKFEPDPNSNLLRPLQDQDKNRDKHKYNILNMPMDIVKAEPIESAQAPYVSPIYASPMYSPNPSLSPHQIYIPTMGANLGPTPPPPDLQFNITYPPNNNLNPINQPTQTLPPINDMLPPINLRGWNIHNTPQLNPTNMNDLEGAIAMNIDSASGLSSLLDLDSQQTELKQINLNSGELAAYNVLDTNNLSENFTANLSLTDVPRNDNMTDSLTRFTQTVYDSMINNNAAHQ